MLKHAAILAVATASALATAQAMLKISARPAAVQPVVQMVAREDAPPAAGGPAQIAKGADGHYWAQANVNGRWVKFLVDTGATDVALTASDAQRLGIDLASLDYERPIVTANGATKAAAIRLERVSVAGATVEDVEAMVVREGLSTSLLGMSYLGRLSRFEATPTSLILRP